MSFAQSAYAMHGTSVCAIGLKVADAKATVERATALGAELFESRVAPGELDIPAIRGVGGGVIHFLDDSSRAVAGVGTRVPPGRRRRTARCRRMRV